MNWFPVRCFFFAYFSSFQSRHSCDRFGMFVRAITKADRRSKDDVVVISRIFALSSIKKKQKNQTFKRKWNFLAPVIAYRSSHSPSSKRTDFILGWFSATDFGTRRSGLRGAEHAGHAPRPPVPVARLGAVALHPRGLQRTHPLRPAPLPAAQFQKGRFQHSNVFHKTKPCIPISN